MDTVSTVHEHAMGQVVQVHQGATAARVSDCRGHAVDAKYDASDDSFVIDASSNNIRVTVVGHIVKIEFTK